MYYEVLLRPPDVVKSWDNNSTYEHWSRPLGHILLGFIHLWLDEIVCDHKLTSLIVLIENWKCNCICVVPHPTFRKCFTGYRIWGAMPTYCSMGTLIVTLCGHTYCYILWAHLLLHSVGTLIVTLCGHAWHTVLKHLVLFTSCDWQWSTTLRCELIGSVP